MELETDRWMRAGSAVLLRRSVVVKRELSQKARFSVCLQAHDHR